MYSSKSDWQLMNQIRTKQNYCELHSMLTSTHSTFHINKLDTEPYMLTCICMLTRNYIYIHTDFWNYFCLQVRFFFFFWIFTVDLGAVKENWDLIQLQVWCSPVALQLSPSYSHKCEHQKLIHQFYVNLYRGPNR